MKTFFSFLMLFSMSISVYAYSVQSWNNSYWSNSSVLNLASSFVVEDFEDIYLANGLEIEVEGTTKTNTLARTFNPNTNDPIGTAFVGGNWSGSNVLINAKNQAFNSYGGSNFFDVTFYFTSGTRSVGFSLEQMDYSTTEIWINGTFFSTMGSVATNITYGGRNGYVMFHAGSLETINTLKIVNIGNDGYAFDYLVFNPIPEASSILSLSIGILLVLFLRR